MKKIKIGQYIVTFALLFFVIYNTYFGWNLKPESDLEVAFDEINKWMFVIGFFFYISPLYRLYEDSVNRMEDRQNTLLESDPIENCIYGDNCIYEQDNTTAMNCKHCGQGKHMH